MFSYLFSTSTVKTDEICPMKYWHNSVEVNLLSLNWWIALCSCQGTPGGIPPKSGKGKHPTVVRDKALDANTLFIHLKLKNCTWVTFLDIIMQCFLLMGKKVNNTICGIVVVIVVVVVVLMCCCCCSIDAVYKVQDFLHEKRPAEALAFLRASRSVQLRC